MNWRTDTPCAVDSPILVRGRTVGGAPCIMAWDDGTPPPGQPWHPLAKNPGVPCWRNTGLDRYGTDAELPVCYSPDELDAQILGYALEWLSLADVLGGGLLEELMELGYGQWRTEESPKPSDSPILVRETGDRDRQFLLAWRWAHGVVQWELDTFGRGGAGRGSDVSPIDISDELQARRIEWLPLREYRGDA